MIGKFSKIPILNYLMEGPYYIPDYQRDYSWEDKTEIKELWDDILMVYNEKIKEFFMGQIVLHKDAEKDREYIIDGQQRTITLTLLYLAIKNIFLELSQKEKDTAFKEATKIESSLGVIDKDDGEEKLILGEADNSFFVDNFLYGTHESIKKLKPSRIPQKNLVRGYIYLYEQIQLFIDDQKSTDEKVEKMKSLKKTISKEFCVLAIETTDESEAFMIFETLNARGKELEISDLLKNYFFRISNKNIATVKTNWQNIATAFENESITNYIRCIWNSKHAFQREKMLYRSISGKYKTPKDCLELSNVMLTGKDFYLSMANPENKHCFSAGNERTELENIFLDLHDLGVKTFYPLLMAYYLQNKDKEQKTLITELAKISKAIETLIFRDIVISKKSPTPYETVFAEIAKGITDMEITTIEEISERLKNASVTDNEFSASFGIYSEKDTSQGKNKIRYILRKMINYEAKEMVIKRNNSIVHIEHIMPITIGKWNVTKKDHEENLWKLGNLTLLDFEINEEIQNALFNIKKEEYKRSEIKMTKDLARLKKWDIKSISKRQADMLKKALGIWTFDN